MSNPADRLPIEPVEGGSGAQESVALVVEVPPEKIVIFQAFFELYEGLGIVRTVDRERSAVALITQPHQVDEVRTILNAEWNALGLKNPIRPAAGWKILGSACKPTT